MSNCLFIILLDKLFTHNKHMNAHLDSEVILEAATEGLDGHSEDEAVLQRADPYL